MLIIDATETSKASAPADAEQFANFASQFFELFQLAYRLSPARVRLYFTAKDFFSRLFALSNSRNKIVHLGLVKLLRQIVDCDPAVIPHLIAKKVFNVVWEIYKIHERRPNLVNSTF